MEKVEEEIRKAKTAIRSRGRRKEKGKKEKAYGEDEGTITKSNSARPRAESMT